MLPVLFLFIVGHESETDRKQMIRSALIDAAASMVVAFAIAIALVKYEQVGQEMVTLDLFMLVPFMRIPRNRQVLK